MVSRIVIIDEVPLFRDGVAFALSKAKGLDVIDEGASLADALRVCDSRRPDVLILGIAQGDEVAATIQAIVQRVPEIAVVCLTPDGREDLIPHLLRAGARGCVSKLSRSAELIRCMEAAVDGGSYISPSLAARVLSRSQQRAAPPARVARRAVLTDRELEILEIVAEGRSNKDIAERLQLSEKTVKRYMTFIMQKINVRNRVQAALYLGGGAHN